MTIMNEDVDSHLEDYPNWAYLLHEWELLYRHGSAGGSSAIRGHRRRVRETLSKIVDSNPRIKKRPNLDLPVTAHLQRAIDLGNRNVLSGMSCALDRIKHCLTWEYGYERISKSLASKYGYCEVVGPQGPIVSNTLTLGFVLFAPNTTYPQHSHQDIEESYISLAGAWSENDQAVYAPGSLILNKPGKAHRITTGQFDPCLLAYAWIGPGEKLLNPKMKFTRTREKLR
ncbi:MAG: dimethylsulfonioproprionate lyase family protein [Pseudomonadota bacterium]